jgi:hypothetical protein
MKDTVMEESALKDVIRSAGDTGPIPKGLSVHRVVRDSPIGPVKVRVYASERAAWQQESILRRLRGKVMTPALLGRVGAHLVFRYLDVDPIRDDHADAYIEIGRFLGILNTTPVDHTGTIRLDTEFVDWLGRLRAMDILPGRAARQALAWYREHQPTRLPTCLDYWDAMPHNFGWMDEQLILLDEKHLRPSYPGVGLVKPSFLFSSDKWSRVQEGYRREATLGVFEEHRPFLEFYYLVGALYFYSLASDAGRVKLARNPRFLAYRERLIHTVSHGSWINRLLGEIHLYRSFPNHIFAFIRRRISLKISRKRKRDSLHKPSLEAAPDSDEY